nr:phage major capsid protein [Cellulomonas sp. APG4]
MEERATAWAQVQDIQARRAKDGYEPTQEDGETYTRALDDVERLSREIEDEERAERLRGQMDAIAPGQRDTNPRTGEERPDVADAYRAAFDKLLRRGLGRLSADEQELLERGFVASEEIRALAAGTDTAGGYTVPEEFLRRMVEAQKAFGGIAQHAEDIETATGADLRWPTSDDTGNVGAILAENTQVTEQDLTFGNGTLGAYTYTSKMVRASLQLLQDSAFDIGGWLAGKLGERIARAAAAHFATGTGTGQPQGLVTGLTLGGQTAAVGAIAYDDLVDLEHAIDPAYRNGNQRYILHDTALRDVRKLKDGNDRPLWVPAIAGGPPSTINGHPYTVDNGLAAVAAGAEPIVFGDIRQAYIVRRVRGAQTMRLTERYADFLQVGFLGFQRLDGKVQNTAAAAALTVRAA